METKLRQLKALCQIKGLISNALGQLSRFGMNDKEIFVIWDKR